METEFNTLLHLCETQDELINKQRKVIEEMNHEIEFLKKTNELKDEIMQNDDSIFLSITKQLPTIVRSRSVRQ